MCRWKVKTGIIEVRFRKNHSFGQAYETINTRKQEKIINTATYYLHKHKLTEQQACRFDVISIHPKEKNTDIYQATSDDLEFDWIPNAFY